MIAPMRNAYVRRVAGSRVGAGARNVAQVVPDTPSIETAAGTKRTGAQEESLLHEGLDRIDSTAVMPDAPQDAGDPDTDTGHKTLADTVDDSLAWNQRLRDATEAYRNTIENLDKTHPRLKPGDVYDAPF